jgi:hypothetical protein
MNDSALWGANTPSRRHTVSEEHYLREAGQHLLRGRLT